MGDNGTLLENNPIIKPSIKTPDNSKELIGNLVTVFRMIPRETIRQVSARGISAENNSMGDANPQLEQIFQDAAKANGVTIDRTKCIFAFPCDPREIPNGLSYYPEEDAIIKMKIDPKGAIVVEGDKYTEAGVNLRRGSVETAKEYANGYYRDAVTLEQYMSEHTGQEDDVSDYDFPEVLIPSDILPYRIEVVD